MEESKLSATNRDSRLKRLKLITREQTNVSPSLFYEVRHRLSLLNVSKLSASTELTNLLRIYQDMSNVMALAQYTLLFKPRD
jgi:hypothetical protein